MPQPHSASRPGGWWCPKSTQPPNQGDNRGKTEPWALKLSHSQSPSEARDTTTLLNCISSLFKLLSVQFSSVQNVLTYYDFLTVFCYNLLFWIHFYVFNRENKNTDGNIPFNSIRLFTDITDCWASFERVNPKSFTLSFFPSSNHDCYVPKQWP